jgi:NRPS condensation-like uncharacterized protein
MGVVTLGTTTVYFLAISEKSVTSFFKRQTRHDPLCGFFREGAKLFSVTNHHIYLVKGKLDADIMKHSLSLVVNKFEVLCKAWSESFVESAVYFSHTEDRIDFDSPVFRENLLKQVAINESNGHLNYPVRFYLIYSQKQNITCVHMAITHDVADIKSGNILMAKLMEIYNLTCFNERDSGFYLNNISDYKHVFLSDLKPEWFKPLLVVKRKIKSNLMIVKRMFSFDRTVVAPKNVNLQTIIGCDFYHYIIPESLQEGICKAAIFFNVTINTIFSGALVKYIQNAQKSKRSNANYTIAVSLRRFAGSAFSESFRSYMIDCKLSIPSKTGYHELLSFIDLKTKNIHKKNIELELGRMENAISLFSGFIPTSLVFWIMKRTQGTNIFYSNPGVIEEDFRFFGNKNTPIVDCAIFGGLIPPYDLMLVTSTINGRMQLDLIYNKFCFGDISENFLRPFLGYLNDIIEVCTD